MFALSRIRVFILSAVVIFDGVIGLVEMQSVERRYMRSVCIKEAVCSSDFLLPLGQQWLRDRKLEAN